MKGKRPDLCLSFQVLDGQGGRKIRIQRIRRMRILKSHVFLVLRENKQDTL